MAFNATLALATERQASIAGLRVTESGSVAGSGAQPLLDKNTE